MLLLFKHVILTAPENDVIESHAFFVVKEAASVDSNDNGWSTYPPST